MARRMSYTTFFILMQLAHHGGQAYGYGLLSESRFLCVSTLYETLERLSTKGLIVRHRARTVEGRMRRTHSLTPAGAAALRDEALELQRRATHALAGLDVFLGDKARQTANPALAGHLQLEERRLDR